MLTALICAGIGGAIRARFGIGMTARNLNNHLLVDDGRQGSVDHWFAIHGDWTQGDFLVSRAGRRHVVYETPVGPLYRPTEDDRDSIREFTDPMSKTNGLFFARHVSRASAGRRRLELHQHQGGTRGGDPLEFGALRVRSAAGARK